MYELTLNDFEYEINGDNLVFKELLNKKEKEIEILDKYNIDGKDYIVNKIGDFAFNYKTIKNVKLPDTIEEIGHGAFYYSNIKNFICPPKVKIIPKICFAYCHNLSDVVLHDDIEKFEDDVFDFSDIKKITIPPKVTKIPYGCFYNCDKLYNVVLHNNISSIGDEAFYFSGIKEFVCPPLVTKIPDSCFENCKNLKKVILHDNITEICNFAFSNTPIEKIHIPKLITNISLKCFYYCRNLKEINLNNINFIEKCAFLGCKNLNVSLQNHKNINIDDYDELVKMGFVDGQINQILKGYKNQIYLNNLSTDTPIDIFRIIVNNFDKDPKQFSEIIKKLKEKRIFINDKLKLYEKINNFSCNEKQINNEKDIII